jgi:uncharacterized membrane protein
MQAVGATIGAAEAPLEFASGHAALGVALAALGCPDLGEADYDPAKQAQDERCLGLAHSG